MERRGGLEESARRRTRLQLSREFTGSHAVRDNPGYLAVHLCHMAFHHFTRGLDDVVVDAEEFRLFAKLATLGRAQGIKPQGQPGGGGLPSRRWAGDRADVIFPSRMTSPPSRSGTRRCPRRLSRRCPTAITSRLFEPASAVLTPQTIRW